MAQWVAHYDRDIFYLFEQSGNTKVNASKRRDTDGGRIVAHTRIVWYRSSFINNLEEQYKIICIFG